MNIYFFLSLALNLNISTITTTKTTDTKTSVVFVVSQNKNLEKEHIPDLILEADKLYQKKQIEDALRKYLIIIEKAKNKGNQKILIDCYSKVAIIFKDIKNFEKAITYNHKSLNSAKLLNDTLSVIKRNLNLSANHFQLYISDSLTFPKSIDSLYYYNTMASKLINQSTNYEEQRAIQHLGLATVYFINKDYHAAQSQVKEALQINIALGDTIGQTQSLNTLASSYLKTGKYEIAKLYYEKAIYLVENSSSERRRKLSRMLHSNLAWSYYKTKDYKAYEYLVKANKISDSLRNAEFDAIITEIEAKHNVDIIKQNAAKKQLIQIQEKKRFQVIIIGLAISLTILILIFWIYSKNAKLKDENKDLLIEKTRLMKEKQIEHIESLTRIKILNATLDGKEAERRQIAETLHDSVSALLSAANLHLQASKNKVVGKIPIEIDKTQTIIDEASGKIRNLSHELISSVLLKFGLSYAIQDFCEKYSNTDLEITASTENLQRYDESFEIKTNNIIEELVNNLIKHSKATEGHVNVMEYRKNLHVEIEDNGVGFDTSKKIESNGIGIHQIEARIKMMKGSFKIHSVMGEGTRIEFTIPITYRSAEYSYSQNYS